MLQVWIMSGLSGAVGRTAAYEEFVALLDRAGCTAVVATDCEQEYLRPLRTGDEITFDAVIESVSPRKTTALGTGHFITTRTEIRANGELAGIHRFRVLRYAPARTRSASPAERPRPVINRDNAGFWRASPGTGCSSSAAQPAEGSVFPGCRGVASADPHCGKPSRPRGRASSSRTSSCTTHPRRASSPRTPSV